MSRSSDAEPVSAPELSIHTPNGRILTCRGAIVIGRGRDCQVRIDDARVSRNHAHVAYNGSEWQIEDLDSGNGLYVNNRRVERAPIRPRLTVSLGPDGPELTLEAELRRGETIVLSDYADRYFHGDGSDRPAGRETVMIRKAFRRIQRRQRRLYLTVIGSIAAVAIVASGYAYYARQQAGIQKSLAEDFFYDMKSIDVDLAALEVKLTATGNTQGQDAVRVYQERRRQLEANYDRFLNSLSGRQFTPQEQVILRVTRLLGECEIAAPPEYMAEVMKYIRRWQSTPRFATGIKRAQQLGYVRRIVEEFRRHNLPPQFFYVALQESDFIETRVGPVTRLGYAKGMWMFIPDTGSRYGLTIGPLRAYPKADPADDRHHWEKSTRAAAAYIKDIYSTDAQASGLLVLASYNWGEGHVIRKLRSMPANPRERNFWKLLLQSAVPNETYNYVFSIVSAAVIGEDPRLFGFDFDNPLAVADAPVAAATGG